MQKFPPKRAYSGAQIKASAAFPHAARQHEANKVVHDIHKYELPLKIFAKYAQGQEQCNPLLTGNQKLPHTKKYQAIDKKRVRPPSPLKIYDYGRISVSRGQQNKQGGPPRRMRKTPQQTSWPHFYCPKSGYGQFLLEPIFAGANMRPGTSPPVASRPKNKPVVPPGQDAQPFVGDVCKERAEKLFLTKKSDAMYELAREDLRKAQEERDKRHRAERERLRRKRKFDKHMNNRIRMLASPKFLPPHSETMYSKFQRFKVFADEGAEPSLKQEAKETRQAIGRFERQLRATYLAQDSEARQRELDWEHAHTNGQNVEQMVLDPLSRVRVEDDDEDKLNQGVRINTLHPQDSSSSAMWSSIEKDEFDIVEA